MNFSCIKKRYRAVHPYQLGGASLALVLAGWFWGTSALVQQASAAPQSAAMSAVYGRGVHAYFAGNTSLAEQYFSQVIQAGSTDPRPYYFRAVLRLRSGRKFEAENDMRVGANHEARNPGANSSIGRSMQRLQGPERRTLEKFRRQARLDRVVQSQQQSQQRYEQIESRSTTILRSETQIPLDQPIQPPSHVFVPGPFPSMTPGTVIQQGPISSPAQVQTHPLNTPQLQSPSQGFRDALAIPEGSGTVPAGSGTVGSGSITDPDDPFSSPAPVTPSGELFGNDASSTKSQPTPAPVPAEADPFGESLSPTPAESDPFAESSLPAPSVETPHLETPQTGTPEPEMPQPASTETDLFGEFSEAAEAPADTDESDPFGDSAESDEEMEFEEPAEEATEAPAEEAPADADESDPFGEDSSSDTTDEEDPFGESAEESSESTEEEETPAEEASADEAPADGEEEAPAEESDEDDPFGPF